MTKEYATKSLGKFRTFKSLEDAVRASGSNPVEVFELTTVSLGWFQRKFLFEKVEAPPKMGFEAVKRILEEEED